MALSRCQCGQVFDIPGVARSYRQPDGRCAKCNSYDPGGQTMKVPPEVVSAIKRETGVPFEEEQKIAVQSGIPFKPKKKPKTHPRKGKSIYPFADMRPPRGDEMDSFFVPDNPKRNDKQNNMRVASAKHGWLKLNPKSTAEFKYRRVVEKGNHGVRVWRVK